MIANVARQQFPEGQTESGFRDSIAICPFGIETVPNRERGRQCFTDSCEVQQGAVAFEVTDITAMGDAFLDDDCHEFLNRFECRFGILRFNQAGGIDNIDKKYRELATDRQGFPRQP